MNLFKDIFVNKFANGSYIRSVADWLSCLNEKASSWLWYLIPPRCLQSLIFVPVYYSYNLICLSHCRENVRTENKVESSPTEKLSRMVTLLDMPSLPNNIITWPKRCPHLTESQDGRVTLGRAWYSGSMTEKKNNKVFVWKQVGSAWKVSGQLQRWLLSQMGYLCSKDNFAVFVIGNVWKVDYPGKAWEDRRPLKLGWLFYIQTGP